MTKRKHYYPEARKIGGVRTRFRTKHVKAPPKSLKHGLDLFDRAMKAHQRRSDLLLADDSRFGQVVEARTQECVDSLGGDDSVTPMLRKVIYNNALREIVVESVAQWMFADYTRIINRRKRDLHPVVTKWFQMSESLANTWQKIGWHRPPPPLLTIDDLNAEASQRNQTGGNGSR